MTWTIQQIEEALGGPTLTDRFRREYSTTPIEELPALLARWQRITEDTLRAVTRGRELAQYDERGEDLPGEWRDGTARLRDSEGE